MKTKQTILEQYKKYLQVIKDCDKEQIPSNFKKFMDFLTNNTEDQDLQTVLRINCINSTLHQVELKDLRLKDVATKWSSKAARECWEISDKIQKAWKRDLDRYDCNTSDEFKVLTAKLFKLIDSQTDPSLQLYMYMAHRSTENGKGFYNSQELELIELMNEEEIAP